ncbi:MAG: GNAT family N-acetyltransferase [Rhizobiaceae bacterium]|nr:GNAT family N-acetyltransferase [Rhizobiaceae bacterium]
MPNSGFDIAFRPVTPDDYPVLRDWLKRPHMREWWGDPEEELGFIVDMVEGRDTTRPFIILLAGDAIGYIQYWHIGHHQNETWVKDNPWLMEFPADAVGVDLSIGDPDRLSKGIGTAALRAFTGMLREQGFETIIIDPDPDNGRAVRAYEKAGYAPVPHLKGRTEGVLLMQHSLNANETHP